MAIAAWTRTAAAYGQPRLQAGPCFPQASTRTSESRYLAEEVHLRGHQRQSPPARRRFRPGGLPTLVVAISTAKVAAVVHHTDGRLLRAARPRFTFSRISEALAVQINGLGSLWCCSTETMIVVTSSLTL